MQSGRKQCGETDEKTMKMKRRSGSYIKHFRGIRSDPMGKRPNASISSG
jgi:hypothetical protein